MLAPVGCGSEGSASTRTRMSPSSKPKRSMRQRRMRSTSLWQPLSSALVRG
uniref:Uncharacterized protein n=1 Tax=Arundo donax TaxID=35708 RepID=A0A0A9FBI1_ARUDO